jgi:hypothetical protein
MNWSSEEIQNEDIHDSPTDQDDVQQEFETIENVRQNFWRDEKDGEIGIGIN